MSPPTPVQTPPACSPPATSPDAAAPPSSNEVPGVDTAAAGSDGGPELPTGAIDRDRLVVVADPSVDAGKATAAKLSRWGLQPILVHDGVEAMLTIQRMLPRVVVLDAALPKMYGFQVCEVIKRNESLRHTGVVLVGAVHNQDRYRRQPADLYGADHYIEQPDLPDGLEPLLQQMGVELQAPGSAATPAPEPQPAAAAPPPEPQPQAAPQLEAPSVEAPPLGLAEPPSPVEAPAQAEPSAPPADDGLAEERANAERLARIIVSDIALYQPDKFAAAIEAGNPVEAMDSEIEEGRVLFAQRIPESVRGERDFIIDELLRVARERGMQ
jgi:CheY-like chemotaxis protein